MRRQVIVIALALVLVGAFTAVSADEAVLIDFSNLKADIVADSVNQGQFLENRATMMDFSGTAGASYTEEQKKQMRTSLAIKNWDVLLASSSKSNLNQALSMTAEAAVASDAKQYAGKTVMGFRVHFPVADYNSWAKIQPPFEIPAFEAKATVDDNGNITAAKDSQGTDPVNAKLTRFEGTYDPNTKITSALGIVKNVGVIKSVAVTVKGLNFPHGLTVVLQDADGNEQDLFMGYLNFDGWKELRWDNPGYVQDVRNRELRIFPLYPKTSPMVKFDGFVITRDAAHDGGDFVAYVKDVKILYDKAVVEAGRDIDDESIWGIVSRKESERKSIESKKFGSQQVLRYLERMKQENKTDFTTASSSDSTAAKK
jgi:Flagellar filament outer layer protein Flaa.